MQSTAAPPKIPLDFYQRRFPDFWATVDGDPYAGFEPYGLARETIRSIRNTAAQAWSVLDHTMPVLRGMPDDTLAAIGIPTNALAVCRYRDPAVAAGSTIVRFDFALCHDGPKILEINAETPMFLWESFQIAGAAVNAAGFADPNAGCLAQLETALVNAVGPQPACVAVTGYNTWREDWFSVRFAARVATRALKRDVDAISLHELRITNGALRNRNGQPIDVLWRMYPLEHFAADTGSNALFDLVQRGNVRLINPPNALLMQNKATMAIVWHLAQTGGWYDAADRATIKRAFLPTFLDQPDDGATYVRKPVLGREGNTIAIVNAHDVLAHSPAQTYKTQPVVYQQLVELPRVGNAYAIVTCFVVGGEPSAIAMRAGAQITDGHAQFVPIYCT